MEIFNEEEFKKWKKEFEAERQQEREKRRLDEEKSEAKLKKAKKLDSGNSSQFDKKKQFAKKIREMLDDVPDENLENVFDDVMDVIKKNSK